MAHGEYSERPSLLGNAARIGSAGMILYLGARFAAHVGKTLDQRQRAALQDAYQQGLTDQMRSSQVP